MSPALSKDPPSWKVLPHRPLEKLAENLWRVEGDLEKLPLKRVMAVARREDGDLVIHNAIALSEPEMAELESLGKVSYLIVPSGFHRMDARRFLDRYPQARVVCPSGARKKVEEVVPVHLVYEEFPADAAVSLTTLDGVGAQEGVMTVQSSDGVSLVVNDALFNMPHVPGAHGFIFKHLTKSSGGLRVSRLTRLLLIKDRAAFAAHLLRLADTPSLRRILVAHHQTVSEDAAAALRAAVAGL
jgi:hypothetical protein